MTATAWHGRSTGKQNHLNRDHPNAAGVPIAFQGRPGVGMITFHTSGFRKANAAFLGAGGMAFPASIGQPPSRLDGRS
jgi:hypothetical protein